MLNETLPDPPRHCTPAADMRRARRLQKLTALLDWRRKIITEGVDSTMDAFIASLSELLKRAVAAKRQGIQLPTFLAMLRDQAGK